MRRIVLLAAAGSIALACAGCASQPKAGTASGAKPSAESSVTAGLVHNVASLAKFKRIRKGMAYDHVVSIMGSGGAQNTGVTAGKNRITVFTWTGPDSVGQMTVTFAKGKVISLTEAGLP